MKVSTRIGLIALMLTLGACGFQSSAPSTDYLQKTVVESKPCDKVNSTELQKALDYIISPNTKEAGAILNLNPGASSLEPLRTALNDKKMQCMAATQKREVKGSGNPAPGPCPTHMVQNFDPNQGGNFASYGVKSTEEVLALAGRDGRYLGFAGLNAGLLTSSDPNPLLIPDNTCLSQKGQEVWAMLKWALTASSTKVDLNAQAPEDYYNTGMVNGQPVVDTHAGIGGDRSAIKYTFHDGSELYVMTRCANIPQRSQGKMPQGETDHQRPPGKTVTPPPSTTATCPPNMPYGSPPNCKDAPYRAPDQQGSAPVGAGKNPGTGETNVYTPPPTTTYQAPPAITRTSQAPPPVITVTGQPTGSPSTATPTQQPPNSGSVVPTSNCGRFC